MNVYSTYGIAVADIVRQLPLPKELNGLVHDYLFPQSGFDIMRHHLKASMAHWRQVIAMSNGMINEETYPFVRHIENQRRALRIRRLVRFSYLFS